MKRWRIAAMLGVALLVAVGAWGYSQYKARQNLEIFLNNKYQMAFFNTSNHVCNLETALAKSLVATGQGEDIAVFSEIWLRADAAQENLTQLPLSPSLTERTVKFLSQAGDYTYTISKNVADKGELSEQHWNTLNRMYRQIGELDADLDKIESRLLAGKMTWSELKASAEKNIEHGEGPLSDFENINRNIQNQPTLIYDGPFSDHLENRKPQGLKGDKINANQAAGIALKFIDKGNNDYTAQVMGKNKGHIEAYTIELIPKDENNKNLSRYICDVSRQGGKVIWYLGNRQVDTAKITIEQAREKSLQFLKSRGLKNMKDTYHSKQGNIVTIQFVSTEKDVTIYPEQVKCTVSLDDGRVLSYEASQYWMTQKNREIADPKLNKEEAEKKLSQHMKVKTSGLAIIPLENHEEVLCWEFIGTVNQDTYMVYINAETGKRERIMMLVDTPDGQLTM